MSKITDDKQIEEHILEAIRSLKYGAVEVMVHDSRIVQVEKTEKVRFDPTRSNH